LAALLVIEILSDHDTSIWRQEIEERKESKLNMPPMWYNTYS